MNRIRYFCAMAAVAVLLSAGAASAQTSWNVAVAGGNGQVVCPNCTDNNKSFYQPLWVRVTDAKGQPVALTAVSWSATSGASYVQLFGDTSYTDANGYASFNVLPAVQSLGGLLTPFAQSTITATAGGSSATFTLTQSIQIDKSFTGGFPAPSLIVRVPPTAPSLTSGSTFTGQIGTTSPTPIQVQVVTFLQGTPVPNIALQIVNTTPGTSTMVCAGQAGAGPDTVLTDQNGVATCNPIFGGVPNVNGTAYVSVGGATSPVDPTAAPIPFVQFPFPGSFLVVQSTAAAPGALKVVSGGGQQQQAGQALAAPLVVQVQSTSGAALAGQTVNWTLSPAGAGALGSSSTTTDSSGQASNTVRLNAKASGKVTVTASLQGSSTVAPVTFDVTAIPPVTLTGLNIVSGNNQSAMVNSSFGAPLVVQLNSSAGVAAGVPVTFTISGPGTLSAATVNTGSNGQASVTVQSTGTAGAITVVASAGGFSQTFNLTVSPPGPTLTASSFMNAADFQRGALSPCSLATIIAPGLAPGLQYMVSNGLINGLQYQLANDTVTVGNSQAPLFAVGMNPAGQQQVTFQVPCDVTPGSSVPVTVAVGAGSASINIPIQPASPGIFGYQMSDGVTRAILVRPDGSIVTLSNPARRGENVTAYMTGLGAAISPLSTGGVAPMGAVITPRGTVVVGMAGRGVPLVSAQLSQDLVGVWLVTFTIPSDINTGNNVIFSVSVIPPGSGTPIPSGGTSIPVQ